MPVDDIDVFTLVDVDDGKDLAGFTIRKCDKVGISDIMEQMHSKVKALKTRSDDGHKKQTSSAK